MNYSPGDIIVCENPLAGPDNYNNKGSLGLGFDFPVDVLNNTPKMEQAMGLDLIADSDFEDISLSSSSDDTHGPASPPLLACRRSPRRPASLSPSAEYAPMRTPSPSLRAWTDVMLYLPTPAVPSLSSPPAVPTGRGYYMPVFNDNDAETAAYEPTLTGLGLGLPPFDDAARVAIIPGLNSPPTQRIHPMSLSPAHICTPSHAGLGLGFAVPGFDSAYRVARASPAPAPTRPRMPRALHQPSIDDDNAATPASPSPAPSGAYAAPVFHAPHACTLPLPLPFGRASVGLGFVDAEGAAMRLENANMLVSPIAGRDSPFWGTYAATVTEEDRRTEQMRQSLHARLPVIEEVIYMTPGSS